ncbi:MAG: hypothetical protein AABY76_08340, partial [Planctomycetota bacterium]
VDLEALVVLEAVAAARLVGEALPAGGRKNHWVLTMSCLRHFMFVCACCFYRYFVPIGRLEKEVFTE